MVVPSVVRRSPRLVAGLVLLLALHLAAVGAGLITPFSPEQQDILAMFEAPSRVHWLGTDENGRDVLARLLHGARASLAVGLLTAVISVGVGTLIGGVGGLAGGLTDDLLMRVTDAFLAVPLYFLWITLLSIFQPTFGNILIVLGLSTWMPVARIVRGEVLRLAGFEFVAAARAIGTHAARALWRHMLPNALPAIVVAATFTIARAILTEAALSFIGLGIQPPRPSWGNMLTNAQTYLTNAPRLATVPGLCIFVTVMAYSLLGDGLRDVLDPTRK